MVSLSDFMRRRNSAMRCDSSSSSINNSNKKSSIQATNSASHSNNVVSCFPFTRFIKKHRASPCSVSDHEATDSTDYQCEIAPWRVERILDGPPREEDWWVNTTTKSSTPGAAAVTSDDSFDSSAGECDHTAEGRLSSAEHSTTNSSSSPADNHSTTSDSNSSSTTSRRFRNRGLETWIVARDAWRQPCEDTHATQPPPIRRSDPPSPAMRKKLIQKVARDRQYTLPRQMPLSEIMSVYQEIWHGDGGEC